MGSAAEIPPTQTCLNCHAKIRTDSVKLALVRDRALSGMPIKWVRVLPRLSRQLRLCLSLALGALFFVILQHLTRSGWSVVIRRLAECIAAGLPVLVVLAVPIVLGMRYLYHWSHLDALPADGGVGRYDGKQPYLNAPFFVVRLAVCFAATAWRMQRQSLIPERDPRLVESLMFENV